MALNRVYWVSLALLLLAVAASAKAQVLQLENTSDITSNFTQTNDSDATGSYFTNQSTPSIGGNSVVNTSGADATATYSQSSFYLPVGDQITVSAYVDQEQAGSGSQVLLELGFGDTSSDVYHKDSNGYDIFSRLYSVQSHNQSFEPLTDDKYQNTVAASETDALGGSNYVTLTGTNGAGQWYLYSVTLQNLDSSGDFQEFVSLQSATVSGGTATLGTTVLSYSELYNGSYANTGLESAATTGAGLYTGFRSNTVGNSGTDAIDNFAVSAVSPDPEPASLGLLATSGIFLLRRRGGAHGTNDLNAR